MNRRGFLASIIALGAAPSIVRSESLMKLWVPRDALQAMSTHDALIAQALYGYDWKKYGYEILEIDSGSIIESAEYRWSQCVKNAIDREFFNHGTLPPGKKFW